MRLNLLLGATLFLCLCCPFANAQETNHPSADQQSPFNTAADLPTRWITDINYKTANLDKLRARQTKKYMDKLARREAALRKRLYRIDSSAAKRMFDPSGSRYASYSRQLSTDSTLRKANFGGGYQPNADTIQTGLCFLQRNPGLLSTNGKPLDPAVQSQLQKSISELSALQAKLQDDDQINRRGGWICRSRYRRGSLAASGLSAASIGGGTLAGAVGAAYGGFVQGVGNAAYFGDPFTAKTWATGNKGSINNRSDKIFLY